MERLAPFRKSLSAAVEYYITHLEAASKSCTGGELVEKVPAAKSEDGMSERYIQDLRSRLSRLAAKFNGKSVDEIEAKDIDLWLRSLEVSPTTRNNFRRCLVTLFSFAVKHGYATNNPAAKPQKAKEIDAPPGILTVQQTTRLFEAASPELLPYVAIGVFAGLRRAELERLDFKEIHFDENLIEVTAQKSKTARHRLCGYRPEYQP